MNSESQLSDPSLDMTMLRRLVEIDKRRKAIEAEDKLLSAERTGLAEELLTQFEQCGVEKASVDGRTVYVRVQLWARANGDMEALCAMLRADEATAALAGETVNTSKLSAHFREEVDTLVQVNGSNRDWAIDYIKRKYEGTLELADQITLQSRGS